MKKALLLLFASIIATTSLYSQDSVYARQIIKALSSSDMYGRGASYHGDSIAASFLANEMKRLGVLPLQIDYFQHYTYNCYSLEGPMSLKINGTELEPYTQYRIYSPARQATPSKLDKAPWKKQLKDGTWLIAVIQLDTYSPWAVNTDRPDPVCIEVLETALPKKVKKVEADIPIHYRPNYLSRNVVGYIPGIIDTMIVFTAHYDHCGTMGDAIIFPGAHDNASGTAAVMDIARIASQKQPYYTIVFMLFSGEELGLKGSKYAAENPLIDFNKVKLLCNIDMFCGGDEGLMVFNANSEKTKPYFEQLTNLNEEYHAALTLRPRDNAPNSDHYWFSNYCPSLFILTMGQPYGGYHDPYDTCEGCGLKHYNNFLSLILRLTNIIP
ncbi:MAG: M28 family peptidase [Bacteroidales bacterium]|nr:M28 family peptidase [Bacteroidales bacterium]